MPNKVIHISKSTNSSNEQYIGRAGHGLSGYFGNPVIIGKQCPVCGETHHSAGETLFCYESYLKEKIELDLTFQENLRELKDKTLVCFCKTTKNKPCHGDVMAKYIALLNNEPIEIIDESQLKLFEEEQE